MAEEDQETLDQEQEPAVVGQPGISAEESLKRQLAAVEKKLRKAERQSRFYEIKTKYPTVTEEDFEEIPVSRWEHVASRIAAAVPAEPVQEAPQGEEQKKQAQEIQAHFAPLPTTSSGKNLISFAEAKAMGGPSNPEVAEMIRKGLVQGVKPPEQ